MTNAEAFEYDFGIYATELWAMPEAKFLEWLNAPCDRERPADMLVRCKDCTHWCICHHGDNWFCADGTPINTASDYYLRREDGGMSE